MPPSTDEDADALNCVGRPARAGVMESRATGAWSGATAIPKVGERTAIGVWGAAGFARRLMGVTVLLAFAAYAVAPLGLIAIPSGWLNVPTGTEVPGRAG